jgi:dephospho-CoA kinase
MRRQIRLALTGSIGMGKSNAAAALRRLGVPVFDADAAVHKLMARGGKAVAPVGAAFPGAAEGGAIARPKLRRMVLGDAAKLKHLESIVHPLVRLEERAFRRRHGRAPLVAFDIPLLFETGGQCRYDASLVVSAPHFVQEARVLARPGITRDDLARIRARQVPDIEKRRRADFVVLTGMGKRLTLARLAAVVKCLRGTRAWDSLGKKTPR